MFITDQQTIMGRYDVSYLFLEKGVAPYCVSAKLINTNLITIITGLMLYVKIW